MSVFPRTINQRFFVELLNAPHIPIVLASGPAGTGKTLLACHVGAQHLATGKVKRLIVTRPSDYESFDFPGRQMLSTNMASQKSLSGAGRIGRRAARFPPR